MSVGGKATCLLLMSLASIGGCAGAQGPQETPRATLMPRLDNQPLAAGTYLVDYLRPFDVSVTVPAGWAAFGDWVVFKLGEDPARLAVSFFRVQNIYDEPCRWKDGEMDPSLGPTVDDLVSQIASHEERQPTSPVDLAISGFEGKMIEWSVPEDVDFATCDEDQYRSFTKSNGDATDVGVRFHQAPGQVDRNYIVDVDGTRIVFDANYLAGSSDAELQELQRIVDSIHIEAPG